MAQADLTQYNLKNSAVKRILQEVKELRKEASKDFIGEPVQVVLTSWSFRRMADSENPAGQHFRVAFRHPRPRGLRIRGLDSSSHHVDKV
jgi:hypothetical protein